MKSDISLKEKCCALGIVFCIVGMGVGSQIKLLLGYNATWISALIALLSTLALVNLNNFTYYRTNTYVNLIFIYSLYCLILAYFSEYDFWANVVGLGYNLVFFLQIVLLWNCKKIINTSVLMKYLFWIIGLVNIVAFYNVIVHGLNTGNFLFNSLLDSGSDDIKYGVTRSATGMIGFWGVISFFSYQCEKNYERLINIVFLVSSIGLVLLSIRRIVLLSVIIVMFLHLRNIAATDNIRKAYAISVNRKGFIEKIIILFLLIIGLFLLYNFNDTISHIVDNATDKLISGLNTYMGVSDNDLAVSYRRIYLEYIPFEYFFRTTIFEFFFGKGYADIWMDIPFLEAFWDLGFFGGIYYLYLQGVVSIFYLTKKYTRPELRFTQYYLLHMFMTNFGSGVPYGKFFPLVLMILLYEKYIDENKGYEHENIIS